MADETIHFENPRLVQQLFGADSPNLKSLEEQLHVKATARDGWIKLDGEPDDIGRAKQLFTILEDSIKAGGQVRNREFMSALGVVKADGVEALRNLMSERIQTSAGKPSIMPKTPGQKKYVEAIREHDVTFGIGPAGTGKTYLAMAMAAAALKAGKISRIILTRPAVEAGEALGFLPGDLHEKLTPYLRPLYDALHDMMSPEELAKHIERGVIEIAPLAYMRGRTLNHAFIVLDESQNATMEQMFMFLTRLGYSSKAVITGDPTQVDLPGHKKSGLIEAITALKTIPGIAFHQFTKQDVVRHQLVQRIIEAYEKHRGTGRNE